MSATQRKLKLLDEIEVARFRAQLFSSELLCVSGDERAAVLGIVEALGHVGIVVERLTAQLQEEVGHDRG